ncbi:hypothetical protein Clacol_007960 [Clathrus columnatus]|uniref:Methyltransferase domain-containing protein n=1 Tax=Clathrus columnatus TaxID=1419009 RepID=A0AAV5ALX0_9AGAM|nr:hypothetical protein Clacol_007960 [Clathrus columnatus]
MSSTYIPNPLDPSLYRITEDEAKFLKECTGITDDEELKQHILEVQAEAYALTGNSAYSDVLKLGKTRENAIMLDIGCGFGNDSRRVISDGFPLQNVLCTDLLEGFFNTGHKLFKTTPESSPLAFFGGDIFDTKFIYPQTTTIPNLSALENIGQLKGQVSVIHASALFHLFVYDKQRELVGIMGQLLSPQPGSIILGYQAGAPNNEKAAALQANIRLTKIHSPETWKDLWAGEDGPFKPDEVEVHAEARAFTTDEKLGATGSAEGDYYWLMWSVLRR